MSMEGGGAEGKGYLCPIQTRDILTNSPEIEGNRVYNYTRLADSVKLWNARFLNGGSLWWCKLSH